MNRWRIGTEPGREEERKNGGEKIIKRGRSGWGEFREIEMI